MSIDAHVNAVDGRVQVLTGRVDDLEKATARLNLMVSDLLRLWSLVRDRPIPDDFGNLKHPRRDGTVHAQFQDRSRSDAPESKVSPNHAPATLEQHP